MPATVLLLDGAGRLQLRGQQAGAGRHEAAGGGLPAPRLGGPGEEGGGDKPVQMLLVDDDVVGVFDIGLLMSLLFLMLNDETSLCVDVVDDVVDDIIVDDVDLSCVCDDVVNVVAVAVDVG